MASKWPLDMEAFQVASELPADSPEKRIATSEIATLKAVRTYLMDGRARIRYSGESFAVPLVRIPMRIL